MTDPITRRNASRTTQENSEVDEKQKSMGMDRLPNETVIEIARYLPLNDLSILGQLSKRFTSIAHQELSERSGVRPKVYIPTDGRNDSLRDRYDKEQEFKDHANKIKAQDNKKLHDLWSQATAAFKDNPLFQEFKDKVLSPETTQSYSYDYDKVLEILLKKPQDITVQDLVDARLCTQEINKNIVISDKKKSSIPKLLLELPNFGRQIQLDDALRIPDELWIKASKISKNDALLDQFLSEILSPKTRQDYNYDYGKVIDIWLREPRVIAPQDFVDIGLCTQEERVEMKLDENFSDTKKSFIRENLLRLFIPKRKIQLKEFFQIPDQYIQGGLVETYVRSKNLDHPVEHITEQNPKQAQAVLQSMFNSGMFLHTKKDIDQMHWAVEKGELELLEKLIKYGAIMDQRDQRGNTVLYIAAAHGKIEMVKYLIKDMLYSQLHSSMQEKDSSGNDALDRVLKFGDNEIAELLFKALKPEHRGEIMLKKNILYRVDNLSYLENQTVRRLFHALPPKHQCELLAQGKGPRGRPFLNKMVIEYPQIAKDLIGPLASSAQVYELLNRQDDDGVTAFGHAIQKEDFELIRCFMGKLTEQDQQKLLAQEAAKGKTAMELAAKCRDEMIFNYFKQISPPLPQKKFNYFKKIGNTLSKLNPFKR